MSYTADYRKSDFWLKTPIGSVIHYDNGFNEYVRGIVVRHQEDSSGKGLRAIALVGNWTKLYERRIDGSIHFCNHAARVLRQEPNDVFTPHESCIFEYRLTNGLLRSGSIDPRPLPPVDLTVPELTEEQKWVAERAKIVDSVRVLISNLCCSPETIEKGLKEIGELLHRNGY